MICLILERTVFEQSWFWGQMWDPKCIKNQRPRSSSQSVSIVQHHSAMLCLRFELCIDVDGAATDFPVGGSNFEVYVSPVTAGAPRCPSGAQVVPGHQDPEYRSTHQLIDLSSFEALSGNTLQQLANEKLTASWQISLGFHDFHGKAHTINCFLYWIWNELYMDFIAGKLVARQSFRSSVLRARWTLPSIWEQLVLQAAQLQSSQQLVL